MTIYSIFRIHFAAGGKMDVGIHYELLKKIIIWGKLWVYSCCIACKKSKKVKKFKFDEYKYKVNL